jgi:sterol desaturase/sphingolipid hydroxylase (fatty acid hydroxylase superfamily)
MNSLFDSWIRISQYITFRYFLIAGSAFVLFYFLFRKQAAFRKIQGRFPAWTHYGRDILYSLLTVVIFATVAMLVLRVWFPYTNLYLEAGKYGWGYDVFTYAWMLVLHDTYFYWMHRLMHHPRLFRAIHLIHHKSTNPSPWTSYAFHPLEAVIEAGIIPLIAFTLPVQRSAMALFLLFQFIYNVYGHLGYELYPRNFHRSWIGRWINTSVCHNLHHKRFKGNYGLYFLWWDRWMGTLREDYDPTFEATTSRAFGES